MNAIRTVGVAVAAMLFAWSARAGLITAGSLILHSSAGLGTAADTVVSSAPATSAGTLDTATFGWSASGSCAMVKIKVFRKNGDSLDFVGESGPYTATNNAPAGADLTTVALSPPLTVQGGDFLGIAGSGAGGCGNAEGIGDSVGTAVTFSGDVTSSISLGLGSIFDGVTLALYAKGTGANGETRAGIIPGAGSLRGGAGSNFKTGVQITNPGSGDLLGRVVVHPAGVSSTDMDASFDFRLKPGATGSVDDVLSAVGLATIDLYLPAGSTKPVVVARVFNDAGANGTTGFTESLVDPATVSGGPGVSVTGVLLGPSDATKYRYNVGVRTLGKPVSVSVAVKDVDGNVVHSKSHDYPANYYTQLSGTDFLGGFAIGPDDTLVITFSGGPAIFYGATVDNVTNDPSAQFMPYLFAIA
jgi:hypothetical protein